MIYITGDTHRNIDSDKLNINNWADQFNLTKDDYLIICGDFGYVWDNSDFEMELRQWLNKKKFTTLFIDGNHENFSLLDFFPTEHKFGMGKVGVISDSIFHLKRGEIYTIDGVRIFTMGGADSIDKNSRIPGLSWWVDEIPNKKELQHGLHNLQKVDFDVDVILSHTCPKSIFPSVIEYRIKETGILEDYLEEIKQEMEVRKRKYKHFFGHYHTDKVIDDTHTCVYNNIIKLK